MPRVFISYSWDDETHKVWVRELATQLHLDGVEVFLDQWHLEPGDQLSSFMERSIRENDFVLIICTPHYKEKSDNRTGGVGYEGDIMTSEVYVERNNRKFVPILRNGTWKLAAPSWLLGKYYVDLSGNPYSDSAYNDLLTTLLNKRIQPPSKNNRQGINSTMNSSGVQPISKDEKITGYENIKIIGIVIDEIGVPRNDGTRGSALYKVPFMLSRTPSNEWIEAFVQTWNMPPEFTTMHRPRIASVLGNKIILNGTTMEEIDKYHRKTLMLSVQQANKYEEEYLIKTRLQKERANAIKEEHEKSVREAANKIRFD